MTPLKPLFQVISGVQDRGINEGILTNRDGVGLPTRSGHKIPAVEFVSLGKKTLLVTRRKILQVREYPYLSK